jgi:Transposase family tnp2
VRDHLSDATFERFPLAFPSISLPSVRQARRRLENLAGFKTVLYDCCPNSCMCYSGPHNILDHCLYCKEPRRNEAGKPRQTFKYTPFIPRLRAAHANKSRAQLMRYRAHEHYHTPGRMTDIFDSTSYRDLLNSKVTVDGKELPFCFFSDTRDIALGLSTDGFAPFKKRKQTTWPIILFNYNLPPDIRIHSGNIIDLGTMPGPKKPKDADSYLFPAVQELMQLEQGVTAFDTLSESLFVMRAYLIRVFGDIPAMSMLMRMKGHNGTCPCRMCDIIGIRAPGDKTLYVPLDRRNLGIDGTPAEHIRYDPTALPLRTHTKFMQQARQVQNSATDAEEKRLSKAFGIKGVPLLSTLSALTFPTSFPYDFMHLIWENLIPNLVLLWTGQFKGFGSEADRQLTKPVWEAIGEACGSSSRTIPSAFGAPMHNMATEKHQFSADNWSFWTLYLAPSLLHRRFQNDRYHHHFVELVHLLNICLQFEISDEEIETVRAGMINWVEDYERYNFICQLTLFF